MFFSKKDQRKGSYFHLKITLENGVFRPFLEVTPGAGTQLLEEVEQKVVRKKNNRGLWHAAHI